MVKPSALGHQVRPECDEQAVAEESDQDMALDPRWWEIGGTGSSFGTLNAVSTSTNCR